MTDMLTPAMLEGIDKLRRDMREAAGGLGHREARFLVDAYYMLQGNRIEAANQVRALTESEEPHVILAWLFDQQKTLENEIKKSLDSYTDAHEIGLWAKTITGIGPVISAGLSAHIDIEQAPTVGHIWRFAGLDPTVRWGKGEKRPWNASLKVLCWKIGESFVKVHANESDIYGKVYVTRKVQEMEKNEAGDFADQAARALEEKKYGKETEARKAYEKGKLPQARIHARAKRYAVKLFLSHWHHVAYESYFGKEPPKPYIIEHGGHVHFVGPPNWPMSAATILGDNR